MVEFILSIGTTVFLLGLGLFAGGRAERRHISNLDEREAALGDMLVTNLRTCPGLVPHKDKAILVMGEAVIASDYLKTFLSGLRNLFGGEMKSFLSLTTRARREAIVRMLERAKKHGYNAVCNVRLDTADIGGATKNQKATIAVVAMVSGTAYHHDGKGNYGRSSKFAESLNDDLV